MNKKYYGDSRYEKVWDMMQLLQIEDVSTIRQEKNGTIVWKLPIKNEYSKLCIEVASFKSGYVRNQGVSCHSNYQLNKRCNSEPQYYPIYKWCDEANMSVKTDKFSQFTTRTCKLIPIEIDRLEYLISYCLKNYYIKHANFVANGDYVPKWKYENAKSREDKFIDNECGYYDRIRDLENKLDTIQRIADHG